MSEGVKPKTRTTLYIDPNVWKAFKKICGREERSMSQKIESFCARYVAVHLKGNPQLRLEPFFGDVHKKCFRCEGIFPTLIPVEFISGLKKELCRECLEFDRERAVVKKVLVKGA